MPNVAPCLAESALGTKVRESGQGRTASDSPHRNPQGGTYPVPSILRSREVRPEKATLSAWPHAFCAAKQGYIPASFSDSCHLPLCPNQSPLTARKTIKTHIHHPPWILSSISFTAIGLPAARATLACPSIAQLPSSHPLFVREPILSLFASRRQPIVSL